jgi:hypothetical protein
MPIPLPRRPNQQAQQAPARTVSAFRTGRAALEDLERDEQKREQRRAMGYVPSRFWLPKGEQRYIIFLDDYFVAEEEGQSGGILIAEHDLVDNATGKRTMREICLQSVGMECPHCRTGEKVSKRFIVSCYEINEWTDKNGNVHPGGRRLLAIPPNAKNIWLSLQDAAVRAGHTMRGMLLLMQRGTEDTSFSIGEPIMQDNNSLFDMLDWDEVVAAYGNPAVMSTTQQGKVVKRENEDLEPVDYERVFSVVQQDTAPASVPRAASGVPRSLPGSREHTAQALQEDEDEIPMQHETDAPREDEQPQRPARRLPPRQAPAAQRSEAPRSAPQPQRTAPRRDFKAPTRIPAKPQTTQTAGPATRRGATRPAPFES